jgi:hypothetical protein
MARPSFQPTEEQRRQVKKLAAVGMPHDVISSIVGITAKTLRKHFCQELTRGDAEGKLHIAAKLMQSVDAGNVTALIYMAKIRLVVPTVYLFARFGRKRARHSSVCTAAEALH